ncbi:superfamily I DNA and/or RNA helicase [Algoriphagus boseongensis]|uniref:Superfamily I DNA and/or RNA helicase n=1 Tax=Algoriphagus boseongensis TaxID=1442587 RepID=A0A4R6T672_9BACT|nr:AAA domain-containing protein [Algoriphagus boseongensis]TDQ18430.1 superfamily I DNA and/or RNA helicase [Algoriphagus boseongensis]
MPESIFQTYLNRLTDLSTKNRSLYLPKLDGFGMLDLREFDFLMNEPSFELIRKLLEGKKKITLAPELDPRSGDSNQVSKLLSRMAFRDQLTQEETGEQSLYIAWLFAEGKLINGQLIRSPLLLKPIQLKKENGFWNLISEEGWQWNPAFALAWRHAHGKSLDESFSDELLENLPKDALEFRTALAKLIPEHFSIQVQSNLFEDQILPFPLSQISLDQEKFSEGKVVLKPYAVLGQIAQKGSFLFSDYEDLIQNHGEASLEDLFQNFFLPQQNELAIREENLFPVFPLDASQESALIKVRQGKSLVIQGPPGTGKSQLIANLVSDYIARGKKVLVVSQKRAALDVVFARLEKAGFGAFLALVHDFRADQKILFEKVKNQIEAIEDYQSQNRGINSIQLERELSQLSKTISRLSGKFEELRTAIFDDKPAGIPIKKLYLDAAIHEQAFSSPDLIQLNFEEAKTFKQQFRVFTDYQTKFEGGFWEKRRPFSSVQAKDFPQISSALKSLDEQRRLLPEMLQGINGRDFLQSAWSDSGLLERVQLLILALNQLSKPENDFSLIFKAGEKKALEKIQKVLIQSVQISEGWKFELGDSLDQLQGELEGAIVLSKSFLGNLRAKFSKSKFPLVFQVLSDNDLSFQLDILLDLQEECKSKLEVQSKISQLPSSSFFNHSGDFRNDIILLEKLLNWAEKWGQIPEIHRLMDWKNLSHVDFRSSLDKLKIWLEGFTPDHLSYQLCFTEEQFLELLEKGLEQVFPENPFQWPTVFSELIAFDQFLNSWKFRDLGAALFQDVGHLALEEKLDAFWNGWRLAWIGEIERQHPILAEMGSLTLGNEMNQLKTAILEKRKNARHLALLRLREQLAEHLEFNRLGNRVTYRDLLYQVSKKRQRWPIRKLVEELGEDLFRLMPCWLGSPETVSAVFPSQQLFDLVIFDEASQCPVERGLPAMLRGKQIVIAGDSKQLRPSDFYQVKWESEEEGMEYEAESLLELASHFFENNPLRGHYRSADPALIHFSNEHFYGNRLETLPDYTTIQAGKTPFSWEKVEGIWENQINKIEAEAVLDRVREIFEKASKDSIGIVTGNYFQMELIRELLWKAGFQGEGIKVRNIENVQGDEFDQVILSLGYAPNREGKLVTNFGLLGKSGAENRLNVAITRARKMLHVISSIEPEDFRSRQLTNPGLALLREFLTFVKVQSHNRSIPAPEARVAGFEIDWSLKNQLIDQDKGYSKNIPSAVMDLIWTDAEGNQKAILTDDQRFFQAPSAKAALAYHPILLEEKGWNWEWKWSRRF